jgi:hypothetical protein
MNKPNITSKNIQNAIDCIKNSVDCISKLSWHKRNMLYFLTFLQQCEEQEMELIGMDYKMIDGSRMPALAEGRFERGFMAKKLKQVNKELEEKYGKIVDWFLNHESVGHDLHNMDRNLLLEIIEHLKSKPAEITIFDIAALAILVNEGLNIQDADTFHQSYCKDIFWSSTQSQYLINMKAEEEVFSAGFGGFTAIYSRRINGFKNY